MTSTDRTSGATLEDRYNERRIYTLDGPLYMSPTDNGGVVLMHERSEASYVLTRDQLLSAVRKLTAAANGDMQ